MTDEELRVRAIQELEFYKKDDTFMLADITVDLAIKALKKMPVTTTTGEEGVIYYPQVEGVTPTVVNPIKTGHWIAIDVEPYEYYECDKCGYIASIFTANIEPHAEYKYCPHCGAKMSEIPTGSESEE